MNNIAIIIPSRLDAQRLPGKPMKLINNKEMILHVNSVAQKANIGQVLIATPDKEIFDLIESKGGSAVLTSVDHETGTDRIYEVFKEKLNSTPEIIINFQGDMPNLNPQCIKILSDHMKKKSCDIATFASDLKTNHDEKDPNVVKVLVKNNIKNNIFSGAVDFFRTTSKPTSKLTFHHVGIYAFTSKALIRYVSLKRSKLEIERKLEQLRALENKMKIDVGYINSCPLSVDTKKDLDEVRKIMKIK